MHPANKSDKPGVAPDWGMTLEPVYADDVPTTAGTSGRKTLYYRDRQYARFGHDRYLDVRSAREGADCTNDSAPQCRISVRWKHVNRRGRGHGDDTRSHRHDAWLIGSRYLRQASTRRRDCGCGNQERSIWIAGSFSSSFVAT